MNNLTKHDSSYGFTLIQLVNVILFMYRANNE